MTEPAKLAEDLGQAVAQAVLTVATNGEELLADLAAEQRADFMAIAEAAVTTHHQWLVARGWKVVPPGAFAAPTCAEEAQAMINAGRQFLVAATRKRVALATPARKLILPPGMH